MGRLSNRISAAALLARGGDGGAHALVAATAASDSIAAVCDRVGSPIECYVEQLDSERAPVAVEVGALEIQRSSGPNALSRRRAITS
jgi:hypothetical protein